MNMIRRLIAAALISGAAFSTGCFQNELFDLAKNGVKLVYAVVNTATYPSQCVLAVTDGEDYYAEYPMYNSSDYTAITSVSYIAVTEYGEVYLSNGSSFYKSDSGLSYYKDISSDSPGIMTWMATDEDSLYVSDNGSSLLWRYSDGWTSRSTPLSGTVSFLGNADGGGNAYCIESSSGYYLYKLKGDDFELVHSNVFSAIGTVLFFGISDGTLYGGGTSYAYIDDAQLSLGASGTTFCRMGASLFMLGTDGLIYKSSGSSLVQFGAAALPMTTGNMFRLNHKYIAIGSPASSPNYLVIYNVEKKSYGNFEKNSNFTAFYCMTVR
jgi:hypothetical protein